MEGVACPILSDALGVTPGRIVRESDRPMLSVYADGWAAPRPEVRTHFAQAFPKAAGKAPPRVYGTDEVCGFDVPGRKGRAIVVAAACPCDLAFFRSALARLGVTPGLVHDCEDHRIFMTSSASRDGERFLHLINLDAFDKQFHAMLSGKRLFGGRRTTLRGREAAMLPIGVSFHGVRIAYPTAEIAWETRSTMRFRLTQTRDVIALETKRKIALSPEYRLEKKSRVTLLTSKKDARVRDTLTVGFG
jgi:beta-galactosidase